MLNRSYMHVYTLVRYQHNGEEIELILTLDGIYQNVAC